MKSQILIALLALIAISIYYASSKKEGFFYNDFTLLNDTEFSLEKRRRLDTMPNALFLQQFDDARRVTCSVPLGRHEYCVPKDTLPIRLSTVSEVNRNPDTLNEFKQNKQST